MKNNIAGKQFNRWTVINSAGRDDCYKRFWLCRCSCGTMRSVTEYSLTSGISKSCGCFKEEKMAQQFKTHGLSKSPEYRIWCHMKARCENHNDSRFGDYGGRGITICARWEGFENFFHDMGPRPTSSHSIERNDTNGNYCPENCRWATRLEQVNNKRSNIRIEHNGANLTAAQWSRVTGLKSKTILWRVKRGRSAAACLDPKLLR